MVAEGENWKDVEIPAGADDRLVGSLTVYRGIQWILCLSHNVPVFLGRYTNIRDSN